MKRNSALMVACLLTAVLSTSASFAEWKYDPESKTLTDGVWKFTATQVVVNKKLTEKLSVDAEKGVVEGVFKGEEGKAYPIDFTEISDDSGNMYYVQEFKNFSTNSGNGTTPITDKISQFIAPDCITLGGNGCFYNCRNLTKVKLSDNFKNFADRSFVNCTSLVDFTPRTFAEATKVAIGSFAGCSSLAGEFYFPKCSDVGEGVFNGCTNLKSVKMPELEVINASVFKNCTNLEDVEFSKDLYKISTGAFYGCASLPGDIIRSLLHPGIKNFGKNDGDVKDVFTECLSLDGTLEWNFELESTNVVGASFFSGCTSLQKFIFKSYVFEIRGAALLNLAPGAEIYMHPEPVKELASTALGRNKGPFSKVYIGEENFDAWTNVIDKTYHIMPKKDFNNTNWWEYAADSTHKRQQDDMLRRMKEDPQMAHFDESTGRITVNQKGVVAFCMEYKSGNDTGANTAGCFWLLKRPKVGLTVKVR